MAIWVGVLVFLFVTLMRNAWLTDDCYITFRTIWNACNGLGLRWNPVERVQTFTHPLWLLLMLPVYLVTGKAWLTAWITGLGCTMAAAVALFRGARTPMLGLAGLVLLLASRAVTDFAMAGLENPLSWLLLVLLFHTVAGRRPQERPIAVGLLSGLVVLNRLDHALFVLPLLVVTATNLDWKGRFRLLLGGTPLLVWLVFATVYYGSPLPNTFYAKAVTGLPRPLMLEQGLRYFWDSLLNDPVTLSVILLAMVLACGRRHREIRPMAVGVVGYLAYVLWIGGDFMTGRFFADPYVVAVVMLLRWKGNPVRFLAAAAAIFTVAILHPHHPQKVGPAYYQDRTGHERTLYPAGIVDEKGMAWRRSSLHGFGRGKEVFDAEAIIAGKPTDFRPDKIELDFQVAVGLRGYTCGPGIHIVDRLGITDPLLSRLPALETPVWRIGHLFRRVPDGYAESILHGENRLHDPELRPLLDDLLLVTRGPLFTCERWAAIFRLNLR